MWLTQNAKSIARMRNHLLVTGSLFSFQAQVLLHFNFIKCNILQELLQYNGNDLELGEHESEMGH